MTIASTINKSVAGAVTLAVTSLGLGVAPTQAEAYNTVNSNPTIGCMLGLLELHGRAVTGSYDGEKVYSLFQIYVWTGSGWQLDEQTDWVPLVVGRYQMAANEYTGFKRSDAYYAAVEHIASWDGTQWQYDSALSSLMNSYAGYDGYYGNGYYARCS